MFIHWYDPAVRLTGRWSRVQAGDADPHRYVNASCDCTTTTAAGSYFELAFSGRSVVLHFDTGLTELHLQHLWIRVDDGADTEVPVDRYLRINVSSYGKHIVRVLYKGGPEQYSRWYLPLMGAVSFIGAEADAPADLPADDRRIIEFIGDSITEGVLTDADYAEQPVHTIDQFNRPYQDDNAATYGALTAKALNLRAMFQAYGAIGITRSGCGAVPRAALIYPYVFDGVPYTGEKPDIVVINHGANDRENGPAEYIARYSEFIDLVRETVPDAIIVCLGAFVGAFDAELHDFVEKYNASHEKKIHFVSSKGWVPEEPLHPLRDGHRIIAEHFAPILKEIIG